MAEKKIVDARGFSCPQPVMMTKKALDGLSGGEVEVLVDTVTSRENVLRFARNAGWAGEAEPFEGGFRVALKK